MVLVLSGDCVKSTEIDAELKGAVLLFYEKDWSSEWRFGGTDETHSQVLIDELSKSYQLGL